MHPPFFGSINRGGAFTLVEIKEMLVETKEVRDNNRIS